MFPSRCRLYFVIIKSQRLVRNVITFTSISDLFLLIAFEKSDLSSANILQIAIDPSGKSFIYIRTNNGPKTDPCGTPAKMFFHEDVCPFKTFP